jgi:hypothetical protein
MRPTAQTPRGARVRLIGVTAVAAAMLVSSSPALGSFPGRNGGIAFDAKFDCGYERSAIGLMGPDGSARRQITECDWGPYAQGPTWLSDGQSLFYWAPGGTWVIAADGSERRQVSEFPASSFAPDRLHFAYVRHRRRVSWIWRARLDGGEGRHLRVGRAPLWSPSGRTIAYYRRGVWIMNARTGKRLRRVAGRRMTPLDWSPDGRRLLCVRYEAGVGIFSNAADLYTVRADGRSSPRRLTRTPARSEPHAAWSPDGRRIVVGAETRFQTKYRTTYTQHFILTMSAGGGEETMIWAGQPFDEFDEDNYIHTPNVSWQPLLDSTPKVPGA